METISGFTDPQGYCIFQRVVDDLAEWGELIPFPGHSDSGVPQCGCRAWAIEHIGFEIRNVELRLHAMMLGGLAPYIAVPYEVFLSYAHTMDIAANQHEDCLGLTIKQALDLLPEEVGLDDPFSVLIQAIFSVKDSILATVPEGDGLQVMPGTIDPSAKPETDEDAPQETETAEATETADNKNVRYPSNPDVRDLLMQISLEHTDVKSKEVIALEFTRNDKKRAASLLRQCRRWKRKIERGQ